MTSPLGGLAGGQGGCQCVHWNSKSEQFGHLTEFQFWTIFGSIFGPQNGAQNGSKNGSKMGPRIGPIFGPQIPNYALHLGPKMDPK